MRTSASIVNRKTLPRARLGTGCGAAARRQRASQTRATGYEAPLTLVYEASAGYMALAAQPPAEGVGVLAPRRRLLTCWLHSDAHVGE